MAGSRRRRRRKDADAVADLLASLDSYCETYRAALGRLVADERLVQSTGDLDSSPSSGRSGRRQPIKVTRVIHSEVAFDLPGNAGWLGFRDVLKVSGKVVRKAWAVTLRNPAQGRRGRVRKRADAAPCQRRPQRRRAADDQPAQRRARVAAPAQPLALRRPDDSRERVHGRDTAIVVLEEKSSPTIIQRPDGGDIVARVMAWVEPETGRLWRTHLRLTDSRIIVAERHFPVDTQVDYVEHEELGLLVPERMTEDFYVHGATRGRGEARYFNFRRFTSGARIVPQ